MSLDFNDAEPQRDFSTMPAGTPVRLFSQLRPGHVGEGGALTQSRSSDAMYLNMEFTVTHGPFKNRKIWQNLTVAGGKVNEQGQSIAAGITRSTIRAMLNSARNVRPDDDSQRAMQARTISSYFDLDGLEFAGKTGIQKGSGGYEDKNTIATVIEPDHKDYTAIMNGDGVVSGGAAAPAFASPSPSAPAASAPAPSWTQQQPPQGAPQAPQPPAGGGAQAALGTVSQPAAPQSPSNGGGSAIPSWGR